MKFRLKKPSDEDGMTLVELIVAMGILTILLTVSMSAVMALTKSTVRAQAVSDATDQLRVTFQRLDKEIRYASAINSPGFSGQDYYLEYLVEAGAGDGVEMCVQWRVHAATNELQRRTLKAGASSASEWQTTVTGLRNDLTVQSQLPFKVQRAGTEGEKVYTKQMLKVNLNTGLGEEADSRGGQLQADLVALNSSTSSPNTVCLNGGLTR